MNNDLISREALKKALTEAHINRTLTFDIATFNCVMSIIDNAPTVEPEKAKESEIIKAYTKGFDTGVETVKDERPQGEFSRKDLESWLYQIAMNNIGTDFEKSVVEIIHRLDGFERFVSEQKGGADMRGKTT